MMNILSQLVQSGNNKIATAEENADKKGMGQKFTQLMMGLLGMESESDVSKEDLLPNSVKTTTEPAKTNTSSEQVKLQHQFLGLTDSKGKTKLSELSRLIDSDVVQLSQQMNAEGDNILSVKIDGEEIPNADSGEVLQLIIPDDKASLSAKGAEKVKGGKNSVEIISLGKGEAEKLPADIRSKVQQTRDSEAGKQAAKAAQILRQLSEQIGALKTDQNLSENSTQNVSETVERLIQNSQNKFDDTAQHAAKNTEAVQENYGKLPLSLKDFPGITITAGESQQTGKGQESKVIPQSAKGEVLKQPSSALKNVIQALSESVETEQKNSPNSQKNTSSLSSSAQKSSQASTGDQKHPVLKHLMNQADETNKSVKAQVMKQSSAESASNSTKQASSGKATFSNLAQNHIPIQTERTSFRPMQSTSAQVALDPSKIINMEADNGAELEMELQSQADKETSTNDDSKSSLRLKNMTMSQMTKSSGRREFSAQLVRQIQQQAEQAKAGSTQKWSHHRFVLDDGEAINLAVRQADGAMQLQLGGGNSELNKIIQQHIDEIRQHLQEQLDVEVDLQLQHFGEQGTEEFNKDPQSGVFGNEIGSSVEGKDGGAPTRTARYLGFNNNEWTA